MFNNLFKLYRTSTLKTPLEDFTTEGLAGILQLNEDICNDFCLSFLNLPEDIYTVETQYFQAISDDKPNCIVDLVIIGEKHVAFIENKVESSEGDEQLLRYKLALHQNQVEKEKYLFYCTKYADPKEPKEFDVNFNQFRWYEVAKFLRQYKDVPLVQSYLEFLTSHKMSQDNTIKSEHLVAMENLLKTIEIVEFHIEKSKNTFELIFGRDKSDRNFHWAQIKNHNRIGYLKTNVLNSLSGKWSEVLYAIHLESLKMITQIYVDSDHDAYDAFVDLKGVEESGFSRTYFENKGLSIKLEQDLGLYLNNEQSDKLIADWFSLSFNKIKVLIQQNNHLQWNLVL
ncbi:MAG: hypothetical protein CMC76_06760 [Flavobacteriaceae bacterium]|nr:hypothetical protein [Flavobacteriaceae bacterium]